MVVPSLPMAILLQSAAITVVGMPAGPGTTTHEFGTVGTGAWAATGTAATIRPTSRATVRPTPNILDNFFFIDLKISSLIGITIVSINKGI
jgi:hypothetical protein